MTWCGRDFSHEHNLQQKNQEKDRIVCKANGAARAAISNTSKMTSDVAARQPTPSIQLALFLQTFLHQDNILQAVPPQLMRFQGCVKHLRVP
jgi:pantothenate kinase